MKKIFLASILLSFNLIRAMENPKKLQIQSETLNDVLVSWKKYLIGEPDFNTTFQAILNSEPDTINNDPVTREHNLDRLLRFIIEKTKESPDKIIYLQTILPKLVKQKQSWKPGEAAKKQCYTLLNDIKQKLEKQIETQHKAIDQKLEALNHQKEELQKLQNSASYHFKTMQQNLNELGYNDEFPDQIYHNTEETINLDCILSMISSLTLSAEEHIQDF